MARPPELAGRPELINEGALIKELRTGRIAGHMVEVTRLSASALQMVGNMASIVNLGVSVASFAYMRSQFNALNKRLDCIEHKIDVIDEKLNVLVGMVQRVDAKVDTLALALSTLRGKIDSRYRDDVFAEIGAVLDTLGYADRKAPGDASVLIMNNLTPARKAIRRFASLIDEYEESLGAGDLGHVETIRMRFLLGTLSIKIDLALGEKESAFEQALELKSAITQRIKNAADAVLQETPLRVLAEKLGPDNLIEFCRTLEAVDGVPPLQRLAANFVAPVKTATNSADRGSFTTIVMECGYIDQFNQIAPLTKNYAGPVILCGNARVGDMAGVYHAKKSWRFYGKLKKASGDVVRKGEPLLDVKLWDHNVDRYVLSAEMVSPIDGIVLEDLTLDIKFEDVFFSNRVEDFKVLFAQSGVCKIAPGLPATGHNDDGEVAPMVESFKTLARLNAAANGVALETSLIAHSTTVEALGMSGNVPFSQDYFVVPVGSVINAA